MSASGCGRWVTTSSLRSPRTGIGQRPLDARFHSSDSFAGQTPPAMDEPKSWMAIVAENPGHSRWYIERFRTMAAAGDDLDGEARLIDAMVRRHARILDAGCGPGRVGGRLHELGHDVVGVDIDPTLVAAAVEDHPGVRWIVGDLATIDLRPVVDPSFDAIVSAGNVMTFVEPTSRRSVL